VKARELIPFQDDNTPTGLGQESARRAPGWTSSDDRDVVKRFTHSPTKVANKPVMQRMRLAIRGQACFPWPVNGRAVVRTGFSKSRSRRSESGQVIVLLLILLAILGGGYWLLISSREKREKEAWAFARDAATRIVVQQDMRFLDRTLSPKAQVLYPPSWRERLMTRIREPGPPQSEPRMRGQLFFRSQFFNPEGEFIVEWDFPTGPASIDLKISHPQALWQIDGINWTWQAPPPPPTPTPSPTASPSPSPSPARKKR